MKQIILLICFMCCFCIGANAQETKKEAAPRVEVKPEIQAQVTIAQSEIEKAEQALLIARLARQNLILKIRLLLNVPNDYVEQTDEKGNLIFVKPPEVKPK